MLTMSNVANECNSNSISNLIEHQHVGVTAELQSPLKNPMFNFSSSTESDNNCMLYRNDQYSKTKYNQFVNEAANETDTTATETSDSKILYEMKTATNKKSNRKLNPSKIEFQLYSKPKKRLQKSRHKQTGKFKKPAFAAQNRDVENIQAKQKTKTILQRLKISFDKMKGAKQQQQLQQQEQKQQQFVGDKIFPDLPEPDIILQKEQHELRLGIYPFDYGCAEYLKTHDRPPQIISIVLAERATYYATRFWAEFFGSLQIGVAFLVTFLLQTYRFVLYSLINILLVEFLHMTSDYLLKPLLTVLFNGYLQPPLIFCFNILSSLRDISEPITDTINNFMKPLATVARSLRLVHVTYNKKNIAKSV